MRLVLLIVSTFRRAFKRRTALGTLSAGLEGTQEDQKCGFVLSSPHASTTCSSKSELSISSTSELISSSATVDWVIVVAPAALLTTGSTRLCRTRIFISAWYLLPSSAATSTA